MPKNPHFSFLAAALAVCVVSCGGARDRVEIVETATRSAHRPPIDLDATSAERFGFVAQRANASSGGGASSGDVPIHWETPTGWQSLPATQFRVANFRLGPDGGAECYLSVLRGGGGGALSNVNRWRGQMGLPAYTDAEFAALPKATLLGQPAVAVDFEGAYTGMGQSAAKENYRMLGVLLEHAGSGIFAKMVGPRDVVGSEFDNFQSFLTSIHLAHGDAEPENNSPASAPAPAASQSTDAAGFAWTAPPGWERTADRPMRLATYVTGETECYITVLGGTGGGILMNVNRWLGQFAQPPLSDSALAELPMISVLGTSAHLLETTGAYAGMGGQTKPDHALLGVAVLLDSQAVFVKMIGPAAEVAAEKDNFLAFCDSLHEH